jgi:hypothetical protein
VVLDIKTKRFKQKIKEFLDECKAEDKDKPDNSSLIYNYLSPYTGGSIRHGRIRAVDVNSALMDLFRDLDEYYNNKINKASKKHFGDDLI